MEHSQERRFDPKRRAALMGDERRARWNPPYLLSLAGLRAGQTALDVGSGPGFWTLPMAEIVGPEGRIIALDVSREFLNALAAENPPPHVTLMHGELPTINLPDAAVDFVWAGFVFHEVEPPAALAAETHRALCAGGRLAVLDWRPDAQRESGPPRAHRLSPQQVEEFLREAGFAGIQHVWQDEDAYLLYAEKRESG
jgi:ubiquinone/menaquinone biosynthesis C-methylase UbiE